MVNITMYYKENYRYIITKTSIKLSCFKFLLTLTVCMYSNDPKFSDRLVWANSVDPDQTASQTAPRGS